MITMAESNSSKTIKIGRGPIRNMNIEAKIDNLFTYKNERKPI